MGQANGTVGYVSQQEAFLCGGEETTLCASRRLAAEAENLLVDGAMEVIVKGA